MNKGERDRILMSLTPDQKDGYQRIMAELHSKMKAPSGRRLTVREMLESRRVEVPRELRTAVEAVMERDEMGPKVGEVAPDFFLKRSGSEERVRLSGFRGKRPVAIIFGSYT